MRAKIGGGAEDNRVESSEDEGEGGSSVGGGAGSMSLQQSHTAALAADRDFEMFGNAAGGIGMEDIMNSGFDFDGGLDNFDLGGAGDAVGDRDGGGRVEGEDDMGYDGFDDGFDDGDGLLFDGFDESSRRRTGHGGRGKTVPRRCPGAGLPPGL